MPSLLQNAQELGPSMPYNLPRRRRVRVTLAVVASICLLLLVLFGLSAHPQTCEYARNLFGDNLKFDRNSIAPNILALGPPHYDSIRGYEKNLPQHNQSLPFPEGKEGRYVKFSNQVRFMGWNNCLNEISGSTIARLMNAHLAYASQRAYVFQDYLWAVNHYRWPKEKWLESEPSTPLNAIIAGPTAGGVWGTGDPAPRSVSASWFDIVCPERRIINTREIKPNISSAPGNEVFDAWKNVLLKAPERCIEIQSPPIREDTRPQTFDEHLWFNATRLESLWELFINSPTSRLLQPSPLVLSAVYKNEYLFLPPSPRIQKSSPTPWDRMMAIHLRKGDFEDHCVGLWTVKMPWYGWNGLGFLPDRQTPNIGLEDHMKRCWPSVDDIVDKEKNGRGAVLDVMYLLTNDHSGFADEIINALGEEGWLIRTTKDLMLDQEQTDVSMAVDMEIASKASVFIGNGWSSFTSNIVHRRVKDGKERDSIRFF
ncbi:hypothetical protein VNI00_010269 [Paramarasmius palmivorus]|uniref:Uncharacterized protein n=1 Tax=Paramarasmius palmivorus TaxID=297713 RepID=A0AAW0CJP3_9AGAR